MNCTSARRDGVYETRRNAVLLNAGAGFYVSGRTASIARGVSLAAALIDSGRARETMAAFIKASKEAV